jgi:hypothetical protein
MDLTKIARGTSEVNDKAKSGKFGIIVGDQVITNLTKVMPNARGYPVQVRSYFRFSSEIPYTNIKQVPGIR